MRMEKKYIYTVVLNDGSYAHFEDVYAAKVYCWNHYMYKFFNPGKAMGAWDSLVFDNEIEGVCYIETNALITDLEPKLEMMCQIER